MRGLKVWWEDLLSGVRPMLAKELRARSRGVRPAALLTLYLLAVAGGISGVLWVVTRFFGALSVQVGLWLFTALVVGSTLLLAVITPALTTGAIAGERERKTLDLLLVTRASPLGIALGKLLSSVVYVLYLLLATIPAYALVYLFGGVPVSYVVTAVLLAATSAVAFAAVGLFFSALFRRTQVATLVSYLVVLFVLFGLPIVGEVQRSLAQERDPFGTRPQGGPLPWYLSASPLVALDSAFQGPEGEGLPLLGDLLRAMLGIGPMSGGAVTVQAVPGGMPATTVYTYGPVSVISGFSGSRGSGVLPLRQTYVTLTPGGELRVVTALAPWVQHLLISLGTAGVAVAGAAWRLGGSGNLRAWLRRRPRVPAGP
ncbi:MAG: ABC transporter permease [Firmicutes bacterium]|nr:ABC transporter permease [Bacillota bacterium]